MEKAILRRVQMEQLDILREIHRVCAENDIPYFLDSGTLIGAIRHKGFIPWDDDIDIGMLREDYDRFSEIAPEALGEDFYWQTWKRDPGYALPFGKVRKRNTVCIEEKSGNVSECGFYVDVFPYDNAPSDGAAQQKLFGKCLFLQRCLLMKHGYKPWMSNGKVRIKARIGYIPYQTVSAFCSHDKMVEKFERYVYEIPKSDAVYENVGSHYSHIYRREWLSEVKEGLFEGEMFYIPVNTHERLREEYGDYMQLPPEDKRENRHSLLRIVFSNGEEFQNV